MLNHSLKLNTKIWNDDIEKASTRLGFGKGLVKAGTNNENIVVLSADLMESTKADLFAEKFPERFIEVGVAEQNMASVASGIASMGKIPFITSYAIFNPGRNWEQIRTTICYNNQPVKIIGSHAGLSVGPDGGSHQELEDIAITRVIPNMVVLSPCDAIEAEKATIACALTKDPTYIRLARNDTPLVTTSDTPFEIGKGQIVFVPEVGLAQVGIISTGPILYKVLIAARLLEKRGIKVKVLNLSTIKPLDEKSVIALAKETRAIVTVEDHQVAGGMGSACAECLTQNYAVPMEFIGVKDKFGQSGTPQELEKHYGIDIPDIEEKVEKVLKRKV
ncbi:MAG TPA: transketolase C-terminal domain-containing protein [Candidatus Paceibacterota bacterium]|nr:transketolase C-terminal domain-containing protein [Candidatus Paceibacterota bacterium]